jgi:glutathione S-transferase
MVTLYYYPGNASFAPHMLLEEIGVPFQLSLVDKKNKAQKTPEYLALNPAGRIPVLVDDGQPLFEAAAICLHLCDKNPKAVLFPATGTRERSLAYQWLMYLTNTVQTELVMYFYPERYTTHVVEAPHIVAAQEVRITEMFALLDRALEHKTYLVGSTPTACDYYLFMLASWADEFPTPPLSFPNIKRVLKALTNRPAVQRVCLKEGFDLTPYQ